VAHGRCLVAVDGDHAGARIGLQAAAGARAGDQAALLGLHVLRKAVGSEHQVALVGLVGPAHGHRVGLHHRAHTLRKTLGEFLDGVGLGQKGTDLVQRLQPRALGLDALRLGLHLGLQAAVERLQRGGHAVEARGHQAEFVLRVHLDAGVELAALDLLQPAAQLGQRRDDVEVAGVEHDHRTGQGQHHHGELEQVEQRGEARELVLDGQHQPVDRLHELIGRTQQHRVVRFQRRVPQGPLGLPQAFHGGEFARHVRVPGHEQGARGVTLAQQAQALVELLHQRLQLGRRSLGLHRTGQAPGLHAHAAGLVDRSGATFELPGDPQREADRGQGQHQQSSTDADQLGGEGSGGTHGHRLMRFATVATRGFARSGCPGVREGLAPLF